MELLDEGNPVREQLDNVKSDDVELVDEELATKPSVDVLVVAVERICTDVDVAETVTTEVAHVLVPDTPGVEGVKLLLSVGVVEGEIQTLVDVDEVGMSLKGEGDAIFNCVSKVLQEV